jgi:hypothetical protein
MILDAMLEFSDAQAVTSTAISSGVIDLGSVTDNATRDIGTGEELYLVVTTNTTATDSGSDATLTVTLESAEDAGLSSNPVVHFSTGALAFATFSPAGAVLAAVRLPAGSYKEYLGVRYTVVDGPLTAGKFDAFLTKDRQAYRAYADRQPIAGNA